MSEVSPEPITSIQRTLLICFFRDESYIERAIAAFGDVKNPFIDEYARITFDAILQIRSDRKEVSLDAVTQLVADELAMSLSETDLGIREHLKVQAHADSFDLALSEFLGYCAEKSAKDTAHFLKNSRKLRELKGGLS